MIDNNDNYHLRLDYNLIYNTKKTDKNIKKNV